MGEWVRLRAGLSTPDKKNTPVTARSETCGWTDTKSSLNSLMYEFCTKNSLKYKI
jgi:hypothetical protein